MTNPIVAEALREGETLEEWFEMFDQIEHFREAAEADFTPEQITEARRLADSEKSNA